MKRSKKKVVAQQPPKKKKQPPRDPRIEEIYEEVVTFTCPVRGLVKQKVKVKRYKPLDQQETRHLTTSIDELAEKLDEKDNGLSIYSDGEELGITGRPGDDE
jgi:hypothetical protein